MGHAGSIFDGRTRYGRGATRKPGQIVALLLLAPPLPEPAFGVGQVVWTPQGKQTVVRRYHESNVTNVGYAYIFRVQPAPITLSNGVVLHGRAVEVKYTEKVLLPLQLASVPPVPPGNPPVTLAMPEPDDQWALNLEAWVRDLLGVGDAHL
jgi:hypothetical protein